MSQSSHWRGNRSCSKTKTKDIVLVSNQAGHKRECVEQKPMEASQSFTEYYEEKFMNRAPQRALQREPHKADRNRRLKSHE